MNRLKQAILQATDGGRKIFEDIYPDAREIFEKGKGYIKLRNEKTASASFKLIESEGEKCWIVKDFGDDTTMNAFDAYMHENNIRYFNEALHLLAEQYRVDWTIKASVNKPDVRQRDANPDEKPGDAQYEIKDITDDELEIMGPTVTREVMEKYNYYALAWYSRCKYDEKKKRNIVTTFYSTKDYPIFMHNCGEFQKIYTPYNPDKGFRFFSIGTKPLNYVFGLEEAKAKLEDAKKKYKDGHEPSWYGLSEEDPNKLDCVIICSGERDAMCLAGMGYNPIWFNSESAKKNNDQIEELKKIAATIYNVPDSDTAGTDNGYELARAYPFIKTILLPAWLKNFKDARLRPCKDLRDFVELRPTKSEFAKLLNTAQSAKFWSFTPKGKVEISTLNLLFFLKINGFAKIRDKISNSVKYIRINKYTVTEYEATQIRDFIRQSLVEMQASNAVIETYINSKKTTKALYDDLETVEIDFDSSTKDGRTLFFPNTCCNITNNLTVKDDTGKEIKPEDRGINITREPLNGKYVWDNKIIPHKFKRLKPAFTIDWENDGLIVNLENNPSFFLRYLINSSRLYWREELEKYKDPNLSDEENAKANAKYFAENHYQISGQRLTQEQINEQAICLLNKIYVIGYLMHRYKIASNAKAIWALEWKNNIEGRSNGRSGKSLFFDTLRKLGLLNMTYMNGRTKDMTNDNFFLDRVSEQTDVLWIDDIKKGEDFDTFYTMITGSVIIKRKQEQSFELKYEDAPNIAFTSNFTPPNLDPSTTARLLFMAFSDYYHVLSDETDYLEERSVRSDVGNICEKDYTEDQYNADINVAIDCLQIYLSCLKQGIPAINPPMKAVKERAQEQNMGEAFKDWADEFFDEDGVHIDRPVVRQAAYNDYIKSTPKSKEQKGKKYWLKALQDYVRYREDLEELNPKGHPWYNKTSKMLKQRTQLPGDINPKSYNCIYIKSKGDKPFSTDIVIG